MREASLRGRFPSLADSHLRITSPADWKYTCIAYAAGDMDRVWNPDLWPGGLYYWPAGVPREDTLAGWTAAFESIGYRACETRDVESGVDKIAIYTDARGTPHHVARQLAAGFWSSKIGTMEDIEHELAGLEGESYGRVAVIMCRDAETT